MGGQYPMEDIEKAMLEVRRKMSDVWGLIFGPAERKEIAERFSNMDDTDLTDNMLKMRENMIF